MSDNEIIINGYSYDPYKEPTEEYKSWFFDQVVEYCWKIDVSCNDTFSYSTADYETVWANDLCDLDPLLQEFGIDALRAYLSLKRNCEVINELQNENYFKCKEIITHLREEHELFTWMFEPVNSL